MPVTLVDRPTPLERAPRLADALGLEQVWLKRDDLGGVGGGGNKLRKLEVHLAAALDEDATAVVTTGAAQSNHARLTAAAGARLGLDVVLVLWGHPPDEQRGNLLLDELLGAEVVWAGDDDAERVADDLARERAGYRVPYGGTSPASAAAYAECGTEVLELVPDVRHVVTAVGSGGTMAGLVAALGPAHVLGVDTGATSDVRAVLGDLLAGMDLATPVDPADLRLDTDRVGAGYSRLGPGVRDAVTLLARTEGVVLDPVYTGRAMAGLVAAVRSGEIAPADPVVLLHTGGLPGLFAHAEM